MTVRLDDQPFGAPEEVDLGPLDPDVDLRAADGAAVAQVAHERLELRARQRRLVVDGGDEPSQHRRTGTPGIRRNRGLDGVKVERPQAERSLDGALERSGREHAREVEERPCRRRDRDAIELRDLRGAEGERAVHDDAVALPATGLRRRGHVDRGSAARAQSPERRGADVAEDRPVAQGEDGRHPASLARQPPVAHREHAGVQPMQPAVARSGVDRADREAGPPQLTKADDAVLGLGDLRDQRVHADRGANLLHTNT